jgi:hypothetical protein
MEQRIDGKFLIDTLEQCFQTLPRQPGNSRRLTISISYGGFFRSEPVNFVENVQARPIANTEAL